MDSQMAHPHGHHQENVGSLAEGEDEDHHEKKSVMKKVKAKAKKLKDTLKLHGHGHDHDQDYVPDDHDVAEEDDDEDEEIFEEPQFHGASAYGSAARRSSVLGQKEDKEQLKVNVGRTTDAEEVPHAPLNTPASVTPGLGEQTKDTNPVRTFVPQQELSRGQPEVYLEGSTGLEEDPDAPNDRPKDYTPSNYQTKVTDPTGAGGEEVGISPILHSLDKMNIGDEPKPLLKERFPTGMRDQSSVFPTGSHDQSSPEPTHPIPIATQQNTQLVPEASDNLKLQDYPRDDTAEKSLNQSSYTGKLYSATSAIAGKAVSAKNVVASKLGYGDKDNINEHGVKEEHDAAKPASPVEYGKKIAATVTEKLTPAYEKVAEAGSTMMSKVHGGTSGTGTSNEAESNKNGQDRGVSVKDYFAEKLKPGEEDKALSEVISEALHRPKSEAENADVPMGKVTQSEEVKRRLGSKGENSEERVAPSSTNIPGKVVVDKLKDAVGSWFVKDKESQASQQSLGSSTGFSASASGEEAGERRLQEAGN